MDLTHVPQTELRRRLVALDVWTAAYIAEWDRDDKSVYLPSSAIEERELLILEIGRREKAGGADPVIAPSYLYNKYR